jgi:hypothetical protein
VKALDRYLSSAIYFFFGLFVILLPWSMKGARYAWIAAFYLWLASLFLKRKRPVPQPLALPLLVFVVLSGISCALSYDPYLSWPHLKLVCWMILVGILFAQNLQRLSQVRTLIVLLLLSAASVGLFTAWQYVRGTGVKVQSIPADSALYRAGIRGDDVLTSLGGQRLHSLNNLGKAAGTLPPDAIIPLRYLRGQPIMREQTYIRAGAITADLRNPQLVLVRAKPPRAQGTFRNWGILAEVLMPIACLAWALLLGTPKSNRLGQVFYGVMFLAIIATIFATQTRAALSGALAGCMIVLLFMSPRRARIWLVSALLILAIGAAAWIQHKRGLHWVDARDPGTQYRLLMWQDGTRLALQHPFFGVGMETIQNHWEEWNIRGFAIYKRFWNFHSDYVQLAAERGLLTLAAWLWFVVAYIIYLLRLLPKLRGRTRFGWAVGTGILAGFVAFLLNSLVESSLGDDALVMLLFFSYGVAVAMERMLGEPDSLDVA